MAMGTARHRGPGARPGICLRQGVPSQQLAPAAAPMRRCDLVATFGTRGPVLEHGLCGQSRKYVAAW
eukprot:6178621-Prymnesium_polylepis.1